MKVCKMHPFWDWVWDLPLCIIFQRGGGRVFGGSRDFGDRAWIEGCCCVCTNSFEGLYFRGWGTEGGGWGAVVCLCLQKVQAQGGPE